MGTMLGSKPLGKLPRSSTLAASGAARRKVTRPSGRISGDWTWVTTGAGASWEAGAWLGAWAMAAAAVAEASTARRNVRMAFPGFPRLLVAKLLAFGSAVKRTALCSPVTIGA